MRVKDAVGRFGEQVAVEHLQDAGVTILDRNWRCREGELDIVARDGDTLVFVEVKTRSSSAFGLPAGAVSARKVHRIRRLAKAWLQANREFGYWESLRFDVIAVLRGRTGVSVEHLRAAF